MAKPKRKHNTKKTGFFKKIWRSIFAFNDKKAKRKAQETLQQLYENLQATSPSSESETETDYDIQHILRKRAKTSMVQAKAARSAASTEAEASTANKKLSKIKKLRQKDPKQIPKTEFTNNLQKIDELLNDEIAFAEIREQRWSGEVQCPSCKSYKVKRRGVHPLNPYCFCYQCELCAYKFDDLTGSGLTAYVRSIRQWILCWYYLGFDIDPEQIAKMMGVSIAAVEKMAELLNLALPSLEERAKKGTYILESELHLNDAQERKMHQRKVLGHPGARK